MQGAGIMVLLRFKDIQKMNDKERKEKIKELKFELIKAGVNPGRANSKTKEIKRAISRLITFENMKSGNEKLNNSAQKKSAKEELKKK
ncbi:hypothetical protein HY450_00920 [Candidatus Pacearchaeota archaeon]|nr:hypothetical protein [Candidatus Pacearchaeota archaeon]